MRPSSPDVLGAGSRGGNVQPRPFPAAVASAVVALVLLGIFLNEAIGPALLAAGLAALIGCALIYPAAMTGVLVRRENLVFWIVPILEIVSTTWSAEPGITFRAALQTAMTVALALMMLPLVDSRRFIRVLVFVMVLITLLSFVNGTYGRDGMTGRVNWGGIYGNKNSMSMVGFFLILGSAAIFATRRTPWMLRIGCLACIVAGGVVCVLARSVGVFVGIALALSVFGVVVAGGLTPRRHRSAFIEFMAVGLLTGGLLAALVVLQYQEEILRLFNKDATLTGRTMLWFYAARFAEDHPWLGYGYRAFWVQGSAGAEFLWYKLHVAARMGFHFHSLFWAFFIELGIVGVALCTYTILRVIGDSFRWVRRAASPDSGFYLAAAVMLLVSQVQAVDFFIVFSPLYVIFLVAGAYSVEHLRETSMQRKLASRMALQLRPLNI